MSQHTLGHHASRDSITISIQEMDSLDKPETSRRGSHDASLSPPRSPSSASNGGSGDSAGSPKGAGSNGSGGHSRPPATPPKPKGRYRRKGSRSSDRRSGGVSPRTPKGAGALRKKKRSISEKRGTGIPSLSSAPHALVSAALIDVDSSDDDDEKQGGARDSAPSSISRRQGGGASPRSPTARLSRAPSIMEIFAVEREKQSLQRDRRESLTLTTLDMDGHLRSNDDRYAPRRPDESDREFLSRSMRRDAPPNAPRASAPPSAFRKPRIFRSGSQRGFSAKSGSSSSLRPQSAEKHRRSGSKKRMSSPGPPSGSSYLGAAAALDADEELSRSALDDVRIGGGGSVENSRDRAQSQPARSPSSRSAMGNLLAPPSMRGGLSSASAEKADGSDAKSVPQAKLKRQGSNDGELLDFSDALDIRIETVRFQQYQLQVQLEDMRNAAQDGMMDFADAIMMDGLVVDHDVPSEKERQLQKVLQRKYPTKRAARDAMRRTGSNRRLTRSMSSINVQSMFSSIFSCGIFNYRLTYNILAVLVLVAGIISCVVVNFATESTPDGTRGSLRVVLFGGIVVLDLFVGHQILRARKRIVKALKYKEEHRAKAKAALKLTDPNKASSPRRKANAVVTFAEPGDDQSDADAARTATGHEKPLEMNAKSPEMSVGHVAASHSVSSPQSPETPSVLAVKSPEKTLKGGDADAPPLSPIHSRSSSPSGSKSDLSASASASAAKAKERKAKDDLNSAQALRNRCIGSERRSFVAMYEILREPVLNAVEAGYQRSDFHSWQSRVKRFFRQMVRFLSTGHIFHHSYDLHEEDVTDQLQSGIGSAGGKADGGNSEKDEREENMNGGNGDGRDTISAGHNPLVNSKDMNIIDYDEALALDPAEIIEYTEKRLYYIERAVKFVEGSSKNLLLSLRLESEGLELNDEDELEEELPLNNRGGDQSSKNKRPSACSPSRVVPSPFSVFSLYVSNTFRLLMYVAICVSIGLTFVDSENQVGNGFLDIGEVPFWHIDLALLALFTFSAIMELLIHFRWNVPLTMDGSRSGRPLACAYACMIAWTGVVFLIKVTTAKNLDYIIPTRVIIIVLYDRAMSQTFVIFLRSIYRAKHVLLLYLVFVMISTCMSYVLADDFEGEVRAFDHFGLFIQALTATFVYVSTGENYTEIVYDAVSANKIFMLIFLLAVAILGISLLIAVVIAVFQESYSTQSKRMFQKQRLFVRLKYCAAYILLDALSDQDEEGHVTMDVFQDFARMLENTESEESIRLFHELNTGKNGVMDVQEFIMGLEYMYTGLLSPKKPPRFSKWRNAIVNLVKSRQYKKFLVFITAIQIWVVALYGLVNPGLVDALLIGIFLFNVAETLVRVFALSWVVFWHPTSFDKMKGGIKQFGNRFELLVILLASVLLMLAQGQGLARPFFRFCLILPAIRLLTFIRALRELMFSLQKAIGKFSNMFSLLFTVMFIYAVIGVALFRNTRTDMDTEFGYSAQFTNTSRAMLTLFQLFVGEAFHEVMYSYADQTSSVAYLYFVSFVIIVTLLFSNLFFGMILSIFARIYEDKNEFHGYRLTPAHLISILDRMTSMPAGGRHPMEAAASPSKTVNMSNQ